MPTEEKKGITVKVDTGLHAEVKEYIESHGMTMAEFVSLALQDELHPKFKTKEDMGNMRTLAFQVPDDLFRRIKDYLQRNNMTQKEFIIGLIETELERDMAERESVNDTQTDDSEQAEEDTGQEETAAVDDFEDDSDEDESEDEEQGFSMGM
ncbi:hypothetical protein [Hominifimenecus sp. rT4P-3]|uniref:hypothetical protein n=1 Tax=Hominifimenecus sp. rT4P-3 TaxID=3242979 RepID=UPI003DA6A45E